MTRRRNCWRHYVENGGNYWTTLANDNYQVQLLIASWRCAKRSAAALDDQLVCTRVLLLLKTQSLCLIGAAVLKVDGSRSHFNTNLFCCC